MAAARQTAARAANQRASAAMGGRQSAALGDNPPVMVDDLEAGSFGPMVVLAPSSASGARQWRRLMGDLETDFRRRIVTTDSIQDTAAERWSRLYVDVRASYGRAAINAALLLNGGASVALLAFLGNLAIAHQTNGQTGNFHALKCAFLCFGIGVMLAAFSSVVAFLIQNVAIAHPKHAEGRIGRRLRLVGIGMVVASLVFFAVGISVAATAMDNLVGSLSQSSQVLFG